MRFAPERDQKHRAVAGIAAAAVVAVLVFAAPAAAAISDPAAPCEAVGVASPAGVEVAQARSRALRAPAPRRGSSAELEGGSSADRYGGSTADRAGVVRRVDPKGVPKNLYRREVLQQRREPLRRNEKKPENFDDPWRTGQEGE